MKFLDERGYMLRTGLRPGETKEGHGQDSHHSAQSLHAIDWTTPRRLNDKQIKWPSAKCNNGRKSFLIGQYHFKNSLAVAFKHFFFWSVNCVILHAGRIFTAGSPAGTIVLVGSLGKASMTLEDPKLVRTLRTSLTRRFCALFFKCVTTMISNKLRMAQANFYQGYGRIKIWIYFWK